MVGFMCAASGDGWIVVGLPADFRAKSLAVVEAEDTSTGCVIIRRLCKEDRQKEWRTYVARYAFT